MRVTAQMNALSSQTVKSFVRLNTNQKIGKRTDRPNVSNDCVYKKKVILR